MHRHPIVEEVRRIKEERAARYNHEVHAMCRALRQEQKPGGREVVSLAQKREEVKTCHRHRL